MKAMILAAGDGTRMGQLTAHTPKPLLKVGQHSLIEHHLYRLQAAGFTEIIINVRYLAAQIQTTLGDGSAYGVNIRYSVESEDLEVAGGIRNALPLLGTAPFALISADIWTDYPLQQLQHCQPEHAHLVVTPHPSKGYALTDHQLQLASAATPRYCYGGLGVFNPSLFADLPIAFCTLSTVLDAALAAHASISADTYPGTLLNIGNPDILDTLRESLTQPQT